MTEKTVVTLRGLAVNNFWVIALCTLLLCIYHMAEAMIAVLLGWVANSLIASENVWHLLGGIAALGGTLMVVSLSWQTGFRLLQTTSAKNVCRIREDIVFRVVSHGSHLADKDSLPPRELPTVIGDDVAQAVDIIEVIPVGLSALVGVVFCTCVLAVIDPPLGAVVLMLSAAVLAVLHKLSRSIERRAEKQQVLLAQASARMADILQGLLVISGVSGSYPAYRGFVRKSEQISADAQKLAWATGVYEAVAVGSNVLLLSVVGLYAGYRTISGEVTLGELVTVVALSQFIAEPMRQCSKMPRFIGLARASVRRLQRIAEVQYLRDGQDVPAVRVGKPSIIVCGEADEPWQGEVRFTEGRLTGVHCSAKWADALVEALVAGEIMDLGGHVNPKANVIWIRGCDIREISVDDLRSVVLAEPRKPALFGTTIGEAVLRKAEKEEVGEERAINQTDLAYSEGTEEKRAIEILNSLGLDDLLQGASGFANVLEYELIEGARNLSGGQQQRLGLARALLMNPEVLVMVDPVSSVDSMTGIQVARAVRDIRRGRTTVVLCTGRAFEAVAEEMVCVKLPSARS